MDTVLWGAKVLVGVVLGIGALVVVLWVLAFVYRLVGRAVGLVQWYFGHRCGSVQQIGGGSAIIRCQRAPRHPGPHQCEGSEVGRYQWRGLGGYSSGPGDVSP